MVNYINRFHVIESMTMPWVSIVLHHVSCIPPTRLGGQWIMVDVYNTSRPSITCELASLNKCTRSTHTRTVHVVCSHAQIQNTNKKKNTYSDNIHKRCLARILQSDQCQFHFLLPEQALEPIQYSIYHRNHFGCGFFFCLFLLMPNRMYNSKGSMPRTHTIRLTLTDVCSNDTI